MVDLLGSRSRFVWSRLERRGAQRRSSARSRAGPSCTEEQPRREWWFAAPPSVGTMPISIILLFFACLRVPSRAPRASREPAGSPIAPWQPSAPPCARSPRRSRRHAKHSNTRSGVPTCSRVEWCFSWITPRRRIRQCVGTSAHAVKTHLWIEKQGLPLDRQRVYEMLQILSVALFEQVPLHRLLMPPPRYSDADFEPIPLVLL